MYRAFGLKCIQNNIDIQETEKIKILLFNTAIELKDEKGNLKVFLDNTDVTAEIRTPEAGKAASIFSVLPFVREKMIELQRKIGKENGVVMDGRDIGTVVFPGADIKIYLIANPETRASRRFKEINKSDAEPDHSTNEFKKVFQDQLKRDQADTERVSSPMKPAEDAIILDSSEITQEEVLNRVINLISKKII
jgi:cytidylate kinase